MNNTNTSIISKVRKYRIKLESPSEFLNSNNHGIALFDLTGTYLFAYLCSNKITDLLHIKKNTYYLGIIPFFIIIHLLTGQKTYLNTELFNSEFNIYKVIITIVMLCFLLSFLPLKRKLLTTKL